MRLCVETSAEQQSLQILLVHQSGDIIQDHRQTGKLGRLVVRRKQNADPPGHLSMGRAGVLLDARGSRFPVW